jgi:hypothetical protein
MKSLRTPALSLVQKSVPTSQRTLSLLKKKRLMLFTNTIREETHQQSSETLRCVVE